MLYILKPTSVPVMQRSVKRTNSEPTFPNNYPAHPYLTVTRLYRGTLAPSTQLQRYSTRETLQSRTKEDVVGPTLQLTRGRGDWRMERLETPYEARVDVDFATKPY